MNLTPKQEAFALAYVKSGSASAAHLEAGYSAKMPAKTRHEEACRLLKNPKVAARVTELRTVSAENAGVTLQSHLAELLWLREMAANSGRYSAAVAAEIARGTAVGLYIKRIAVSGGLELTEKADLSKLSTDELLVLQAMMAKAGMAAQALH